MKESLGGLHTTYKNLSDGKVTIYVYAWKGGPRLDSVTEPTRAAAAQAVESLVTKRAFIQRAKDARQLRDVAAAKQALADSVDPDALPVDWETNTAYIAGLIHAFKKSAHWNNYAESTTRDYAYLLSNFEDEFGDWRVETFSDRGIRRDLMEWRDSYADTPRKADYSIAAVGALFSWARDRGITYAEPCRGMPKLHKANRAAIIWTPQDLAALKVEALPHVYLACELAAHTSLRQGDLLRMKWDDITDDAISIETSKRKRHALIPLTPAAHLILDDIGRKRDGLVLTSIYGTQWTADGFRSSFWRAKTAAGLERLHFHDLRGTACTNFAKAGASRDDLARIMAWSRERIDLIMDHYVDRDVMAREMLDRMGLAHRQEKAKVA